MRQNNLFVHVCILCNIYKAEERVALRKQGLNEKTAASVLLKLFINGNERCERSERATILDFFTLFVTFAVVLDEY